MKNISAKEIFLGRECSIKTNSFFPNNALLTFAWCPQLLQQFSNVDYLYDLSMTLVVFLSFYVKNNFLYLSFFIHRQHAFKARNFYGLSKSVFNSNFIFTFAICYSWTQSWEGKFLYFGYINWENTTSLKREVHMRYIPTHIAISI